MTDAAPDNGARELAEAVRRALADWQNIYVNGLSAETVADAILANGARFVPSDDDYRDHHERAMRDHILGGPDDHRCDDLCSAAILDRLAGKHPVNEYPLHVVARPSEARPAKIAHSALHPEGSAETAAHVWVGDHGVADGGNIPPPEVPPHDR